eukprot:246378_1
MWAYSSFLLRLFCGVYVLSMTMTAIASSEELPPTFYTNEFDLDRSPIASSKSRETPINKSSSDVIPIAALSNALRASVAVNRQGFQLEFQPIFDTNEFNLNRDSPIASSNAFPQCNATEPLQSRHDDCAAGSRSLSPRIDTAFDFEQAPRTFEMNPDEFAHVIAINKMKPCGGHLEPLLSAFDTNSFGLERDSLIVPFPRTCASSNLFDRAQATSCNTFGLTVGPISDATIHFDDECDELSDKHGLSDSDADDDRFRLRHPIDDRPPFNYDSKGAQQLPFIISLLLLFPTLSQKSSLIVTYLFASLCDMSMSATADLFSADLFAGQTSQQFYVYGITPREYASWPKNFGIIGQLASQHYYSSNNVAKGKQLYRMHYDESGTRRFFLTFEPNGNEKPNAKSDGLLGFCFENPTDVVGVTLVPLTKYMYISNGDYCYTTPNTGLCGTNLVYDTSQIWRNEGTYCYVKEKYIAAANLVEVTFSLDLMLWTLSTAGTYVTYDSTLYTTSINEKPGDVWNYKGIIGHLAVHGQHPRGKPLYRLHKNKDYFLTTSETERTGAIASGYVDEGILGDCFASPNDIESEALVKLTRYSNMATRCKYGQHACPYGYMDVTNGGGGVCGTGYPTGFTCFSGRCKYCFERDPAVFTSYKCPTPCTVNYYTCDCACVPKCGSHCYATPNSGVPVCLDDGYTEEGVQCYLKAISNEDTRRVSANAVDNKLLIDNNDYVINDRNPGIKRVLGFKFNALVSVLCASAIVTIFYILYCVHSIFNHVQIPMDSDEEEDEENTMWSGRSKN